MVARRGHPARGADGEALLRGRHGVPACPERILVFRHRFLVTGQHHAGAAAMLLAQLFPGDWARAVDAFDIRHLGLRGCGGLLLAGGEKGDGQKTEETAAHAYSSPWSDPIPWS